MRDLGDNRLTGNASCNAVTAVAIACADEADFRRRMGSRVGEAVADGPHSEAASQLPAVRGAGVHDAREQAE